jgi:hypothetical protein
LCSDSGAFFGHELSLVDDAVVVSGNPEPVFLWLAPESFDIRDASPYQDSNETKQA